MDDEIGNSEDGMVYWMAVIMTSCAAMVFILVQFITFPYGRYAANWGCPIEARSAWLIQEFPSLAVPVLLWLWNDSWQTNVANTLLMIAFLIHYFHRSLIYPFLMAKSRPVPLVTFIFAIMFCSFNGFLQSRSLLTSAYSNDWVYTYRFISGMILFFFGMSINMHSDHSLRKLRKPGETGYKIPRGGCFEYVSGANYLGEMIEWIGFALACWSFSAFSFALFTVANIGPRAMHHHRWYRKQFDDYPQKRKALIPFIL